MAPSTATLNETRAPGASRLLWLTIPLFLGLELVVFVMTEIYTIFALGVYNAEGACGFVNRGIDSCDYSFADLTLPISFFSGVAVLLVTVAWIVVRVQRRQSIIWGPLVGCLMILLMGAGSFFVNSYFATHW